MMHRAFQLVVWLLLGLIHIDAQVINAGIAGNTSTQLLARIENDVLKHKPDLVIVMVGTNDMLNSRRMNTYKQYSSNLSEIVNKLKQNNAQVVLLAPPPVDSIYLFERHDRTEFKELPNVKLDSVRHIVARTARKNQVYFIDIFQKFQDLNLPKHNEDVFIMNPNNSAYRDGVHPTRLGNFFVAENVFNFLRKMI
ncbi:SGNH/GDSL hydrolase family protein [Saccharicrinis sp. 156]|uniref:SGNH/GDSL hydrolase family protein n=1 Tax=Saccharicrinis sp. 156 TaxID=3417574 RepID=UPI003D329458